MGYARLPKKEGDSSCSSAPPAPPRVGDGISKASLVMYPPECDGSAAAAESDSIISQSGVIAGLRKSSTINPNRMDKKVRREKMGPGEKKKTGGG
jgi:hypothetical protein